jgi:hypothetical protein
MQRRFVSFLWFIGVIVAGEGAMFGADFQFRHHFISRKLPISDKGDGDTDIVSKPGPAPLERQKWQAAVDFLENLHKP